MGDAGFGIDQGFVYRTAARQLGIRYDEVEDTPDHIIYAAYEDWQALRDADLRLAAKLRSF